MPQRLTTIGALYGNPLDELPQLLNVLRGNEFDMGPRYCRNIYQYIVSFKIDAMICDLVLRVGHRWMAEMQLVGVKFEYDVWYVDNMSFVLDKK
jgi:lipopolysaccharide/colanic/teichoic acid biosynthesis glycosyltransferase